MVPARAPAPGAEAPLDVRESANAVERAALSAAPAAGARALAKMYLVTGRPDRAVDALAPFVSGSRDAAFLSDTSAAYFARARDGDRAHALDAAARAVEIDPRLVEAWFNFGLASEALGQVLARREGMGSRDRARSHVRVGARGAPRNVRTRRSGRPGGRRTRSSSGPPSSAVTTRRPRGLRSGRSRTRARFSNNRILTAVAERWDEGDRPALTAAVARAEVAGRALGRLSADRWPVDVALQLRGHRQSRRCRGRVGQRASLRCWMRSSCGAPTSGPRPRSV